ncbi:MAG: radical SAM protein [Methanomassiliicoccales archaeon]
MKIRPMEAGSAYTKRLAKGCVQCRQGEKLVLLVTGECGSGCYYCPISEAKRGRDVVFANEQRVSEEEDVLAEARAIGAKGTGITGGDPLTHPRRTCSQIKSLKKEFGSGHHVHLYTSTIDPRAYQSLERCGLDELRIHPQARLWGSMERSGLEQAVKGLRMEVGIEVPAIPGKEKELESLIRFADRAHLDFVNLNELEFSETNAAALKRRGFEVKDDVSAAVKGSEELALRLLQLDVKIPLHYCSSSFKDSVQLRRRIMRRARRTALPSDMVTDDGTLLKGVIETSEIDDAISMLNDEFNVPTELIHRDEEKKRLEVAPWVLQKISAELPYDSFIVEEYPTADRLEVERERLPRLGRTPVRKNRH